MYLSQKLIGHTDIVTCIDNHLHEEFIASGSLDKSVKIWKNEN
jgi:WD40 repeat protein